MAIQLSVIGLDRVGVSFGLALADQKTNIQRCGYDPIPARIKKAESQGAFDKLYFHLREAVHEADVVLLSLPVDQIENTLKEMADDLKEGAIVINTAPVNVAFIDWAKKLLLTGRHFLSMIPAGSGAYLHESAAEAQVPHDDLFKNADILIPTDVDTHSDAVSMVSELTSMIGAKACFIDPLEADGMLAKVDLLPKLVASALLHATVSQPGWQDARRVASTLFAQSTSAVLHIAENEHPAANALSNRNNAILALDGMIASLVKIRAMIEAWDQKSLDALLTEMQDNHAEWMDLRSDGDWEKKNKEKIQRSANIMGRFFGIPKNDKK